MATPVLQWNVLGAAGEGLGRADFGWPDRGWVDWPGQHRSEPPVVESRSTSPSAGWAASLGAAVTCG